MTFRIPGVAGKSPDAFVELSPELAAERRVTDGQYVRLVSESGAIRLRAVVTGRVSGNEVFVPMNSRDAADAVNRLTGQNKDTLTNTPAYKDTRVRMEVLSDSGPHPLPRTNHRWGHPTPQRGVEVERKWQRPDYVFPGGELPLSGASLNARTDRVGNSADD